MTTTIAQDEVEKFSKIASEWWDPNGKFKPLHIFNPVRIGYLRRHIIAHFNKNEADALPFSGLKLLDIGCGGGLLSEPMRRLGADITGIDASEKNIKTAMQHAKEGDLNINYLAMTSEELAQKEPETYDVILNMEVIEHVADPMLLVESCAKLLKPNGIFFIATLNRTLKSFGLAIIGAEYILRWLPIGTHDWNKFLKPGEIQNMGEKSGLTHQAWQGVSFNILTQKWSETDDLNVNYMGYFTKDKTSER
ncbi:MAG: bifunctional 2-polyprenyl-6-hydroxyphenol methylase/3-demethylubiquinol 3-O-methyltransferase UbiG [Pseudomonadota bacterium]